MDETCIHLYTNPKIISSILNRNIPLCNGYNFTGYFQSQNNDLVVQTQETFLNPTAEKNETNKKSSVFFFF